MWPIQPLSARRQDRHPQHGGQIQCNPEHPNHPCRQTIYKQALSRTATLTDSILRLHPQRGGFFAPVWVRMEATVNFNYKGVVHPPTRDSSRSLHKYGRVGTDERTDFFASCCVAGPTHICGREDKTLWWNTPSSTTEPNPESQASDRNKSHFQSPAERNYQRKHQPLKVHYAFDRSSL